MGNVKELKRENKLLQIIKDILIASLGCLMFSYAYHGFLTPNKISVGGAGGIAAAINSAFGIKMGTLLFMINLPLLILAYVFINKRFAINTMLVILLSSLIMNYVTPNFPKYQGDPILGSVFGGLCCGVGVGLVFTRGFTTGGTDIISRLIQIKFPSISIGRLMLLVDVCIICLASYIFTLGDGVDTPLESAMYGLIATFIDTKTIDTLLTGLNRSKIVYIISDKYHEISEELMSALHRGLTRFDAEKVFSRKEAKMIMCVARSRELTDVKKIIKNIDKAAFVMVLNADDVIGGQFPTIGI